MRNHRKPAHANATKFELPDGTQVELDRPFSEYTSAELAALGITPGLGGEDTIAIIAPDSPRGQAQKDSP